MPKKTSRDKFCLSNALHKKLSFSLTSDLTTVFNDCIEKCFFPECLKHAKVVPIHKCGDRKNPSNFRPISLLSMISKILKKFFSEQICSFLEKKTVFSHTNKTVFERKYQLHMPCLI